MKYMLVVAWLALVLISPAGNALADSKKSKEQLKDVIYLDLKYGRVTIKLLPKLAPNHVERVRNLVREGFFDGLKFHRVIQNFMAQTGDPTGTGNGGSRYPDLNAEISKEHFRRGTIGAARGIDPNSANSQFFICFEAAPWLDGKYTIWGEVVKGMQFVDLINKGDPRSGEVAHPDIIVKMTLAYDDKQEEAEKQKKKQ